jgi:hypothetical protein
MVKSWPDSRQRRNEPALPNDGTRLLESGSNIMGERESEKRRSTQLSLVFDEEFGLLFKAEAQDFGEFAAVFVVERFSGTGEIRSWAIVWLVDRMEGER